MNHHMKNARRGDTRSFFWALLRLLTLCLLEILVKRFFFKILFPTFAISLKNGDSYSKKYSFEVFSQKMPPIFHFSWNPGDRRPIVNTSVEAACLCWPGALHCLCFFLLSTLFALFHLFTLCVPCLLFCQPGAVHFCLFVLLLLHGVLKKDAFWIGRLGTDYGCVLESPL